MSVACDGCFLYVHDPVYGLMKIGCGYGNTVMVRCLFLAYFVTFYLFFVIYYREEFLHAKAATAFSTS